MGANLSYATVDLAGRVAIVTGSNTGTGYETAKALARMGAKVVMACRSQGRAEQAIERMRKEEAESTLDVEYAALDLSSLASTQAFADWFLGKYDKLNILCCNAGYIGHEYRITGDGMESVFQTNYLSHFLLVTRLLPILKSSSPDPRIVSVSSMAHKYGVVNLAATHQQQHFSRLRTYSTSKLYQVMMTGVLHRRLEGTGMTASSIHPGMVSTEFSRDSSGAQAMYSIASAVGASRTPAQGAASIIYGCVNPELEGQQHLFIESCKPTVPSSLSRNVKKQDELFDYSVSLLKNYLHDDGAQMLGIDLANVVSPPPQGAPVEPPPQELSTTGASAAPAAAAAAGSESAEPSGAAPAPAAAEGEVRAASEPSASSSEPATQSAPELAADSASDEPTAGATTDDQAAEPASAEGGEKPATEATEEAEVKEEAGEPKPADAAEKTAADSEKPSEEQAAEDK